MIVIQERESSKEPQLKKWKIASNAGQNREIGLDYPRLSAHWVFGQPLRSCGISREHTYLTFRRRSSVIARDPRASLSRSHHAK